MKYTYIYNISMGSIDWYLFSFHLFHMIEMYKKKKLLLVNYSCMVYIDSLSIVENTNTWKKKDWFQDK